MRDMGGGGGSIYTAYTKWRDLDCKLDRVALLIRLYGLLCERDCVRLLDWPREIYMFHPLESY